MRILHITGYTVERGGTSKVAYDHMSYQLGQGHEVDILTIDYPNEKLYTLPEGTGLIKAKFSRLSKLMPDFSVGVYDYLKQNHHLYDIIHIHGIWHWGSIVPFIVAGKPKIIISIHGMLSRWALGQGGLKKKIFGALFQKRFLRKADAIVVLTEAEKEELLEFVPLRKSKIYVIPNGIEKPGIASEKEKEQLRKHLSLDKNATTILFLSRIHKKKGLDLLIKAFDILRNEMPQAVLLIAGPDEGYKSTVENMIKERELESKVKFLGSVSGKEKETVFSIADVFVLSSYSEGLPMAVLEAMSLEIPVVVSDQTRIDTFILKYNAGKVVSLDENDIYMAIKAILEDPQLKNEYVSNGTVMVTREFGAEAMNEKILSLYRNLITTGIA